MIAIFHKIAERIIKEISNANSSVTICLAWFTNTEIIESLLLHSKDITIEIILQDVEENRILLPQFNQLIANGAKVYFIRKADRSIIHHKFCIIDYDLVITGSYNWTRNATQNNENITIFTNADVAFDYLSEFDKLLSIGGVKKETKTILNDDKPDELPYSNVDLEHDIFKKNIKNALNTAIEWIKK